MHRSVLLRIGSLSPACLRTASSSSFCRPALCPSLSRCTSSLSHHHLVMFQRAVNAHSQNAPPVDLSKQLFPSSSPTPVALQPANRGLPNQRTLSTQNTLRPSPAKGNVLAANGLTKRPYGTNTAVKRTSSGLAKAIGGHGQADGFDDMRSHAGSQVNPVVIEDGLFDENDFDSDIDLEIENPAVRSTTNYTSKTSRANASFRPVTYPPPQNKAMLSTYAHTDSDYGSAPPPLEQNAPPSSIPVPWSSSPAHHLEPPQKSNPFSGYAYTAQNVNRMPPVRAAAPSAKQTRSPAKSTIEQADTSIPRAPKRRTLPWLEADAQPSMPDSVPAKPNNAPSKSTSNTSNNNEATPVAKTTNDSPYPWSTTASAIKEQQKKLRQANNTKKLMKENEATVDSKAKAIAVQRSKTVARPHLSKEQRHVLKLVVDDGKSVFFTGSAGTGKSVLLREIIAVLRRKHQRETDRVAITASTGLAACNIGGVTLHSFSGIGLGKESVDELIKKIKKNQKARHRWMRTKVLIIDEVSMVDGDLFDKLEEIARRLRNNGRPFGGIQLVITGDFFQLPPVPDYGGRGAKFAFDAKTWDSTIVHTIGLTYVFRQKDPVFAGMLNEMREGRLSQASIAAFKKLDRPLHFEDDLQATELFPTRNEVEYANTVRMKSLSGDIKIFDARDGGSITDQTARDKLLQNCLAPPRLELKKGSQVMLIKNIDEMLVNGSLGKVIGFMDEDKFNTYNAEPEVFEQANESDDEALKKRKLKIRTQSLLSTTSQAWPLVRFAIADGTTRDLLCQRELWKVELPNGEVQASRQQVPLILAWALSIHKAQGQTLERVKVDLGKVFEKGQAYVALSRATSMNGLQVMRFDPSKVLAHDKVRTFYASLSRAEMAGKEDREDDYDD